MRIITISREFGSGGRELGKRLADHMGYDYYDNEILTAVAEKSGMDDRYVEKALSGHGWRTYRLSFRRTLCASPHTRTSRTELLLTQKRVIEEIAALGQDCVIVGRNADVILRGYHPFRLFVCAELNARVMRCMERMPQGEELSQRELLRRIKQIDASRAQTRELIGGSAWGQRDSYHLTVNTTGWEIRELVPAVADFAAHWFRRKE